MNKLTSNDFMKLYDLRKETGKDVGLATFCKENEIDLDGTLSAKGFDFENLGAMELQKFYATNDPVYAVEPRILSEYIRDAIILELGQHGVWKKLVATTTHTSSQDARITWVNDNDVDANGNPSDELVAVAEGEEIPAGQITFKSKLVQVTKKGRRLDISYEANKAMKLDVLKVHLKKIAAKIDLIHDREIIEVLFNGNITTGVDAGLDAAPEITLPVGSTIQRRDLLNAWLTFVNKGYNPQFALMSKETALDILELDAFKDSNLTKMTVSGSIPQIFGSEILVSPFMPADTVMFVDPAYAIEHFIFMNFDVESDKIINRQINFSVASMSDGFGLLYQNSRLVLRVLTA